MANNKILNSAKSGKKDEFYTSLDEISNEVRYYRPHFEGKKVLCNCNDALHTGFAKFFSLQFELLGLKELICTSFAMEEGGHGVVYRYHGDKNGNRTPDIDEWEQIPMHGNGGFNTPEGLALIDEADIVVTNPPFSLFREFISVMVEHNKKFLIIGNVNAIGYKEVFPLIMDNKLWLGVNKKSMIFNVPDDYPLEAKTCGIDTYGKPFIKVNGIRWYTNLDNKVRHEEIILYKKYNEEEFPKYDNYDAIEVNKVADIPLDYEGIMGVPITFLDKYNPDQFEIVGEANHGKDNDFDLFAPIVNGKVLYKRILIRFKK